MLNRSVFHSEVLQAECPNINIVVWFRPGEESLDFGRATGGLGSLCSSADLNTQKERIEAVLNLLKLFILDKLFRLCVVF